MAADAPDIDIDPQDAAEAYDETHLNEDAAEFSTLEELPEVFDATTARGDARDVDEVDEADLDPEALDDEDLEDDEDDDDALRDDLEDQPEDDDLDDEDDLDSEDAVDQLDWDEADVENVADVDEVTDPDDEDADEYESPELSDEDLKELGYKDDPPPASGATPEDVADESHPRQEELLDEGIEETFPASDPVSVKRIT